MANQTIVVITGANTGLGLEIVKSLYATSAKRYHIILGARSINKANEAIATVKQSEGGKDSGTTFEAVQIDLESDSSISAAYEHIQANHPRIDALVNNGGAAFDNELAAHRMTARETWNKAYDVNVAGTQVMTTAFIPLLLKSSAPRLLFVTSGGSTLQGATDPNFPRYNVPPAGWPKPAAPSFISYRSSKTALNMLMIDWDRILRNDGVKVWCISPGLLATSLGGNAEALKKMGAEDPVVGGNFIRDVLEGKRDMDLGSVLDRAKPLKRSALPHYPARVQAGSRLLSTPSSVPEKPPSTQSSTVDPPPTREPGAKPKLPKSDGPATSSTTAQTIAAEARRVLPPSITETYVAYGSCEKLVTESARQAAYTIPQASDKSLPIPKTKDGEDLGVGESWWYQTLGLTPTFNTWAQVTFLHMYLLTVRMRCFPAKDAPIWHQHLLDQFFYTAEDKMVQLHNVHSRAIRNKYLKDLYIQWRGLLAGYDEGLIRGDAVLAAAVWRNVFKADEDVDFIALGQVISYMRGVLKGLDGMSDRAIANGEVVFGSPGTERPGVLKKSAMMATLNDRIEGEFEQLSPA